MQNQPAGADADNATFSGTANGIAFDEMTLPFVLCGGSETSYARMADKHEATKYNNFVDAYGSQVWVKVRIIHPIWWNGREIRFEIVDYGLTKKTESACDCQEKEEVTPPTPPVIKEPTPVKEKPAVVKEEPTPVVKEIKKEIAAKDLQPCFKAKDYEVITIIKERGKVVSETTTNLGDVVDAGGPSLPDNEVDAGEN
ncbi:hypothetical protein IPJ63_01695 [Candidatus Nomurabacteria bacterium]|nr:MAG: hypothetical protein IPJ63_01695 [Candidatus Nomurabacteria bacterium]